MIFVGDIAVPYRDAIKLSGVPQTLLNRRWFGNLEGSLVADADAERKEAVVFNGCDAIEDLVSKFDFSGFALANNHIFDTGSYKETVSFLNQMQVPFVGVGSSLATSGKPLVLREGGKNVIILNFGWEVIQCEVINGKGSGVNPLRRNHVLESVERAIRDYPEAFVLPFMHWSYELEDTPQPFERQLAKKLIDIGAAGVIGCHPHRIGGFELYNNRPIVYSLGNWLFRQDYYHKGKLRFPDFCNLELAFEWDFITGELKFHFFEYDRTDSSLRYVNTEGQDSPTMRRFTPFRNFTDREYIQWYKKNHYHKNKGLPIYYWEDSDIVVSFKNRICTARDFFIKQLSNLRSYS